MSLLSRKQRTKFSTIIDHFENQIAPPLERMRKDRYNKVKKVFLEIEQVQEGGAGACKCDNYTVNLSDRVTPAARLQNRT